MLGNDVIDLRDAETQLGAQHPRFDARVFRSAERAAIAAAACAESARRTRWALFAAKEASYKLVRRLDEKTPFVPARFAVTLAGEHGARVTQGGRSLEVAFEERAGGLHAVASLVGTAPSALLAAFVAVDGAGDEGEAARALARERVAAALGIDPARLSVVREARLPALRLDGERLDATLSLSHHGRFAAFACRLAAPDGGHRRAGHDARIRHASAGAEGAR
jgi:hypothetical protein